MTPSLALRSERSAVSPEVAGELRDALCRRQKELPARWLAAVDATALREGGALPSHEHEALERALGLALLRDQLPDARPRGIVCIQPSASAANFALADALCQRGSVTSIAAAELDSKLAVGDDRAHRLARASASRHLAVACDCTIDLPLPDGFPRPRVLPLPRQRPRRHDGRRRRQAPAVVRTTMNPGDSLILGLEPRQATAGDELSDDEFDAAASRHLGALRMVNTTVGVGFDLSRLRFSLGLRRRE